MVAQICVYLLMESDCMLEERDGMLVELECMLVEREGMVVEWECIRRRGWPLYAIGEGVYRLVGMDHRG